MKIKNHNIKNSDIFAFLYLVQNIVFITQIMSLYIRWVKVSSTYSVGIDMIAI